MCSDVLMNGQKCLSNTVLLKSMDSGERSQLSDDKLFLGVR